MRERLNSPRRIARSRWVNDRSTKEGYTSKWCAPLLYESKRLSRECRRVSFATIPCRWAKPASIDLRKSVYPCTLAGTLHVSSCRKSMKLTDEREKTRGIESWFASPLTLNLPSAWLRFWSTPPWAFRSLTSLTGSSDVRLHTRVRVHQVLSGNRDIRVRACIARAR